MDLESASGVCPILLYTHAHRDTFQQWIGLATRLQASAPKESLAVGGVASRAVSFGCWMTCACRRTKAQHARMSSESLNQFATRHHSVGDECRWSECAESACWCSSKSTGNFRLPHTARPRSIFRFSIFGFSASRILGFFLLFFIFSLSFFTFLLWAPRGINFDGFRCPDWFSALVVSRLGFFRSIASPRRVQRTHVRARRCRIPDSPVRSMALFPSIAVELTGYR